MVLSMANPWKHPKTGVYYRRVGNSRQHCQRRKSREAAPWSRGPVRGGGQPGRHLRRSSRADWQSPPVDRHRRPPAHGALLRGIGAIEAAATAYREKIFAATDDQFAALVPAISARLREMLEATSYSTREFVDLIFLINRTSIGLGFLPVAVPDRQQASHTQDGQCTGAVVKARRWRRTSAMNRRDKA